MSKIIQFYEKFICLVADLGSQQSSDVESVQAQVTPKLSIRRKVEEMAKLEEIHSSDSEKTRNTDYAESDISDDEFELIDQESLVDRLAALKDIVPPHTRAQLQSSAKKTFDISYSLFGYAKKFAWIVTTSAIVTIVPLMIAMEQEQAIVAMEQEYQMQQQGAQQMLQPNQAIPVNQN